MKVLLYSLDEAVLTRCAEEIKYPAPGVDAVRSSDHVGSAQLRQKARSADLGVIATRCAKHAATGFITQHAHTQHIFYADGSGSASMLQKAADAPVASLCPPLRGGGHRWRTQGCDYLLTRACRWLLSSRTSPAVFWRLFQLRS
ncbi:hypothetical protein ACFVS7_06910 [Streptomyces rubiginosohelvolus]|uniref:hypothetical protein n=1 Tax=Streptomyces rubiginosohelvolus TaxID=67362 RepID=UPI0036DECB95